MKISPCPVCSRKVRPLLDDGDGFWTMMCLNPSCGSIVEMDEVGRQLAKSAAIKRWNENVINFKAGLGPQDMMHKDWAAKVGARIAKLSTTPLSDPGCVRRYAEEVAAIIREEDAARSGEHMQQEAKP